MPSTLDVFIWVKISYILWGKHHLIQTSKCSLSTSSSKKSKFVKHGW